MKAQAALVWTESGVELHSIAAVNLDVCLVILPDDSKLDDALRNGANSQCLLVFGMLLKKR